ncbi:hypothetical protein AVEN_4754-1 [Araneus ventricosus]|uniref:DUF4817 domain-containing protein n=1 Tax=Araneus ventricosus TaxID=182803 RepID=A0A4Y2VZ74_ARAVE|nr:hypothetical protein AVEN_4754-1 [Araneus ventricosus]
MANYMKVEFVDLLLAHGAADCSGPAAQRLYAERYPMRRTPSHNFFARMHRKQGSFQRSAMNRERSARTLDIEENVLHQVQEIPSLSMRRVAQAFGVSRSSVWRILREKEIHPCHVQRVQTH